MTPHGFGCLFVGLAVGSAFALVGAGIEWVLAQFGQKPAFDGQVIILAGLDGIGVASVWYWRSTLRAREYGPMGAFWMFVFLGVKFGGGPGLLGMVLLGLANGLLGAVVACLLVFRPDRNGSNGKSNSEGSNDYRPPW